MIKKKMSEKGNYVETKFMRKKFKLETAIPYKA